MNIKITKQYKKAILVAVPMSIALFYSQWEIPTLLHGREFDNSSMIDHVMIEAGSMFGEPDFIKVIDYGKKEADILWVWRGEHIAIKMNKVESRSGELKWKVDTWHFCTPANGSVRYFFPWYGGIPSIFSIF